MTSYCIYLKQCHLSYVGIIIFIVQSFDYQCSDYIYKGTRGQREVPVYTRSRVRGERLNPGRFGRRQGKKSGLCSENFMKYMHLENIKDSTNQRCFHCGPWRGLRPLRGFQGGQGSVALPLGSFG